MGFYSGQENHFAIAHSTRVSHIVFTRPIAYSHIAYRIRAARNVFASHIAFARPITYCISHIIIIARSMG